MSGAGTYSDWISAVIPRWISERLSPYFTSIDGTTAVSQAVARRLETPHGFLIDAPNDCIDLRQFLNARMDAPTVNAIRAVVKSEAQKDDRVDDAVTVAASADLSAQSLTVTLRGTTGDAPFSTVLTIGAFLTTVQTGTPSDGDPTLGLGTDVDTYGTLPPLPTDGLTWQWGERFARGLGEATDAIRSLVKLAVKARFVSLAPDDALQSIGSERMMPRYPSETLATYRARLAAAWSSWTGAGTKAGMLTELNAFGFSSAELFQFNGDGWSTSGTNWARFWIVIKAPFPFNRKKWGDGGAWGDGSTWGSSATVADISSLRQLVRRLKSAQSTCAGVIFVFSGNCWEPSNKWGSSGTWGGDVMLIRCTRYWGDDGAWSPSLPWVVFYS